MLYWSDTKIIGGFDGVLGRTDVGQEERAVLRELEKEYG
mgnify:CR=1 FL=1